MTDTVHVLEGELKVPAFLGSSIRWVVLTKNMLFVYKDKKCVDLKDKLDLSVYKEVNKSKAKVAWFELVDTFGEKNKRFIADTEKKMNIWVDAIQNRAQIHDFDQNSAFSSPSLNFIAHTENNDDDDIKQELSPLSMHVAMTSLANVGRTSTVDSTNHQRSPSQPTDIVHDRWQYVGLLKQKMNTLEKELLDKEERVQSLENEIESLKVHIGRLNAEIFEKTAAIKGKDGAIHNLQNAIREKSEELTQSKASNISYKKQLDEWQMSCNVLKQTISDLEDKNHKAFDDIKAQTATLKVKDGIIEEKNGKLSEQSKTISTSMTTLKDKRTTISTLQSQLQSAEERIQRILQKEDADGIRDKLFEGKKGWLTFITVIIAMCSLFSSLGLSKFFKLSDSWNGRIAMGTSIFSLVLTSIKFGLSYITFDKHYHNNDGLNDDNDQILNKNKKSHQFLMKAIYVTVSTINDCVFDILMGVAAITGEPYTFGTFGVLLAATWFGALEEFGELIVEIFFDTEECSCLCCSPIKSYAGLLVWSYVESVLGIYLLTTYDNEILKWIGIPLELFLGNFIVASLIKFRQWTQQYNGL